MEVKLFERLKSHARYMLMYNRMHGLPPNNVDVVFLYDHVFELFSVKGEYGVVVTNEERTNVVLCQIRNATFRVIDKTFNAEKREEDLIFQCDKFGLYQINEFHICVFLDERMTIMLGRI